MQPFTESHELRIPVQPPVEKGQPHYGLMDSLAQQAHMPAPRPEHLGGTRSQHAGLRVAGRRTQ